MYEDLLIDFFAMYKCNVDIFKLFTIVLIKIFNFTFKSFCF